MFPLPNTMTNDRDPLVFRRKINLENNTRLIIIPYPLIQFLKFTPGEKAIFMADHDKEGKIIALWNKKSNKTKTAARATFEADFWTTRINGLTFPQELITYLNINTSGHVYLQARKGKYGCFIAIWEKEYEKKRMING